MESLLLIFIYIAASFIQGVTGFGFGVFSTPLIALIFSPGIAVGMNAILGTINCTYNYFLLRHYVNYRKSFILFFIGIIFIPIGAYFLVSVSEHIVFLVMGVMVVLLTLHSMWQHRFRKDSFIYTRIGFIFPVLAGAVAGAFAAPGPVLAPYMFAQEKDPYIAKANLQFIFSLMSVIIITSHIVTKNLNMNTVLLAIPYIPLVFVFTKIGSFLSFKIKKELFKIIESIALLLLGSYLVVKNLYSLIII